MTPEDHAPSALTGTTVAWALRLGVLALVVAPAAFLAWRLWPSSPRLVEGGPAPDPRLTYAGPFLNVHPSVPFVGDAACAGCHPRLHEDYRRHPMGRSMVPIETLAPRQSYDAGSHNPFEALGHRLRVEHQGGRVWHGVAAVADGETLYEGRQRVHFAVGSGTRGYSYLRVEDGFVFQTPISWFSQKAIWDLSPGFRPAALAGRSVAAPCLQCHVNQARTIPGEPNRFEREVFAGHAIGCERCHGPGGKHVASPGRAAGGSLDFDPTIVNPARLPWRLRDAVCEQCHLAGQVRILRRDRDWFDFRPGLPLEQFLSVFVTEADGPGATRTANHVEQMHASKCFEKSPDANKLGCLSCHDPHRKPAAEQRVAFFRDRCLKCHETKPCSVPPEGRRARAPGDSCIDCHMTRKSASDIPHTALTDHTVPRDPRAPPAPRSNPSRWTRLPVASFHLDRLAPDDPEGQRDLGVALVRLRFSGKAEGLAVHTLRQDADRLLGDAVERHPGDAEAWVARGEMLADRGQMDEGAAALERALALAPRNTYTLERLAVVAEFRRQPGEAAGYWRRLTELAPLHPEYWQKLATLAAQGRDWDGVRRHARALLKLDPSSVPGRFLLLQGLVEQGDKVAAGELMAILRKTRPENLAEIERWFAARMGR